MWLLLGSAAAPAAMGAVTVGQYENLLGRFVESEGFQAALLPGFRRISGSFDGYQ